MVDKTSVSIANCRVWHIHELYFMVNQVAIDVLGSLPSYVFCVILLVWFVSEIVNDVVIQRTGKGILFTHEKVSTI